MQPENYIMSIQKAIKYFEFHVFQAVPEKPQPSFGINGFGSNEDRLTGLPLKKESSVKIDKNNISGYFVDDFENKTQSYQNADNSSFAK